MKKYRIMKENEDDKDYIYYITYRFLNFLWWIPITDTLEAMGYSFEKIRHFKSIKDAENFIKIIEEPIKKSIKDEIVKEINI